MSREALARPGPGGKPTCDATIRRLAFGPIVRPLTIGVELFRLCRPCCVVWRAGLIVSTASTGAVALLDLLAAPSGHCCPALVNTRGISGTPEGLGS